MQYDLSRLSGQELTDFLIFRGVQPSATTSHVQSAREIALAKVELQNALAQGGQATEAVVDLILATNTNITNSPQYTEAQINSLDPTTLDAFAKIFGLTGSTPNIQQRIIRMLRIKGLLLQSERSDLGQLENMFSALAVAPTPVGGGTVKERKDAEGDVRDMPVSLTGARPDEFLIGIRNVTRDAMIIPHKFIPAITSINYNYNYNSQHIAINNYKQS